MQIRTLMADGVGEVVELDDPSVLDDPSAGVGAGWVWIDVDAEGEDDLDALFEVTDRFGFDRLAVHDSVLDLDMPKLDDFGHHLLAVFHGLRDDRVATYEVDCFITDRHLVTVHQGMSPAIEVMFTQVRQRAELAAVSIDEIAALLADVLTRRLLRVLEAFDEQMEALVARALAADAYLLEDLTAVRADLAGIRRAVHPQRETLDVLRHSTSPLLTDAGRRRFSDAFDVASRAAGGLDEARAALAETLDAYRGAEARQATDVTKVLTIYAAIMLPLSLVAGFFGMNFVNLPWLDRSWGWVVTTGLMVGIAVVSLGIFVSLGWIRRPSGRETGKVLGRGLLEATRTPVQLVGAVVEISTLPLRATGARLSRRDAVRRSSTRDESAAGEPNPR